MEKRNPQKKLYHLQVVLDVVVAAEEAEKAADVFMNNKEDIIENDFNIIPPEIKIVGRITSKKDLPKGWDDRCIPWGGKEGKNEFNVKDYI